MKKERNEEKTFWEQPPQNLKELNEREPAFRMDGAKRKSLILAQPTILANKFYWIILLRGGCSTLFSRQSLAK